MDAQIQTRTRQRRRRTWPSAADDARVEVISILFRIDEYARAVQASLEENNLHQALTQLETITHKTQVGRSVLNQAREL